MLSKVADAKASLTARYRAPAYAGSSRRRMRSTPPECAEREFGVNLLDAGD